MSDLSDAIDELSKPKRLPAPRAAPTLPPDLRSQQPPTPQGVPSPAIRTMTPPPPRPRSLPKPKPTPGDDAGPFGLQRFDPAEAWYTASGYKPGKGGIFGKKPPPPRMGPFGETLGWANIGGIMSGAALQDILSHRDSDDPQGAMAHANRLMMTGRAQDAADLYFPTSIKSLKVIASHANPLEPFAQVLLENPRLQSIVDGTARALDPSGGAFGDAVRWSGLGIRLGASKLGPVLADAYLRNMPEEAEDVGATVARGAETGKQRVAQALRYLQYMDKRFGAQRGAAEDLARAAGKRGKDVTEAGDEAEMAARNVANVKARSNAEAFEVRKKVFGGLDNADIEEIAHLQEGESDLLPINRKNRPLSPEEQARYDRLMPRVQIWRNYIRNLDYQSRQVWGDNARFLSPARFMPRQGLVLQKGVDDLSDGDEAMLDKAQREQAYIESARTGGGLTARKGTLVKARKYATLKQLQQAAQMPGAKFQMNPNVTVADSTEALVRQRLQAIHLDQSFKTLENLHLLVPIWKEAPQFETRWVPRKGVPPMPQAAGRGQLDAKTVAQFVRRMKRPSALPLVKQIRRTTYRGVPNPQPPGYYHFTDLGDIRGFGLERARDSWIHPTVRGLITEAQGLPERGQGGAMGILSKVVTGVNNLAARLQVANPLYHPVFNLRANVESALNNPAEWVRFLYGMTSPRALARAQRAGAFVPHRPAEYSKAMPKNFAQAWPEIQGRFDRATRDILYSGIEPRVAAGLHHALTPRLGSAGAALETRSVLGEPENIGRDIQALSKSFEFPAWFLSQMRRWSFLPLRKPQIFNAAQTGIADWNAYHGRSPQPSDDDRMFPPIYLGRTPWGDNIVAEIPHPADRPLRIWSTLAKAKAGQASPWSAVSAAAGGVTPLAQPISRATIESLKDRKALDTWAQQVAASAPTPKGGDWLKNLGQQAWQQASFYMVPVPPIIHTEIAGTRTLPVPVEGQKVWDAQLWRYKLISGYVLGNRRDFGPQFRYGIIDMRQAANRLQKNPDLLTEQSPSGAHLRRMMNQLGIPLTAGADGLTQAADQRYAQMQKALQYYHYSTDPLSSGDQDAPWRGAPYLQEMAKTILGRAI
jgi:hypothetical protein